MDAKFQPAVAAIIAGDLDQLKSLIAAQPALATDRSSKSHPTLLQCLVLDAMNQPNQIEMARVLIDAEAEIDGPLVAAACIGNTKAAEALLDAGAAINGDGVWSPLEEALYWGYQDTVSMLLRRGATIHNLRIAAGLGRIDVINSFFAADGSLKPEAGIMSSPFRRMHFEGGPQDLIDNALIYACISNRIEAVESLVARGARINAIPPGFDYAGTALHYAALFGHKALVDLLIEEGARLDIRDTKVNALAAGWAAHGRHQELSDYLTRLAGERSEH
jgi:ankyrin repeat protein